jgi:hypothetical protein
MDESKLIALQCDASASTADFQERVLLEQPRAARPNEFRLPTTGWRVADSRFDYHRFFPDPDPVVRITNDFTPRTAALTLLLAIVRPFLLSGDWSEWCDAFVFQCLLVEVLWRTQPAMRRASLAAMMSKNNAEFSTVWQRVTGADSGPGINRIKSFHGAINSMCTFAEVSDAAARFNIAAAEVASLGNHVVLDEIVVNCTSKIAFRAREKNAAGFEFFVAAMPVAGTGTSAAFWLKPRVWRAKKGPSMSEIVQGMVDDLILKRGDVALPQRPLLVVDSRFLTSDAIAALLSKRQVPFVGVLHSEWHGELIGNIEAESKAILKQLTDGANKQVVDYEIGAHPLIRAQVNDRQRTAVSAAASTSTNTTAAKRSAAKLAAAAAPLTAPPAKRARTAPKKLGDYSTVIAEDDCGAAECDMAPQPLLHLTDLQRAVLGDQLVMVEWYRGINKRQRKEAHVLLSNGIDKVRRSGVGVADPDAPLHRAFDACWRRVDQVNKRVKENVMLHSAGLQHPRTQIALYFDYLLSSALDTAYVLVASASKKTINGDGDKYSFEEFGITLARMCHEITLQCGRRGSEARAVSRAVCAQEPKLTRHPQMKKLWRSDATDSSMARHFMTLVSLTELERRR